MSNVPKEATKKEFPKILEEACGIITSACQLSGIARETYRRWCIADIDFKIACDEARKYGVERGLDRAESALFRNIDDGKETSCIFYLKTQGKHRGYIESDRKSSGNDIDSLLEKMDAKNYTDEELATVVRVPDLL